jgi:hypothetical protein
MKLLKFDQKMFDHVMSIHEAQRQYSIIAPHLSWEMLAGLEPRLADLLQYAQGSDTPAEEEGFCRESIWYEEIKPQLVEVVGYGRSDFHPILMTSAAYELAYHTILRALPDCRNCSCFDE